IRCAPIASEGERSISRRMISTGGSYGDSPIICSRRSFRSAGSTPERFGSPLRLYRLDILAAALFLSACACPAASRGEAEREDRAANRSPAPIDHRAINELAEDVEFEIGETLSLDPL